MPDKRGTDNRGSTVYAFFSIFLVQQKLALVLTAGLYALRNINN